jgi:hypothetical protein
LAVNDRGRRAGVAPHPFAICHHERVVYPVQSGRRRARRQTSGKSFPMAASRSAAGATGSPPARHRRCRS